MVMNTGDRFLAQIASRLVSGTRAGDLVGRYGGDEFVMITPVADDIQLKERLEKRLIGRYEGNGYTIDYGGASTGLVKSLPDEAPETLLARADAAMFEAKKARKTGRPSAA